jgi:glucose-6-phosphate isomerase
MNTGCSLPHLGFTLHSSVLLEFTSNWVDAVQAMLELEGGVIANPTEGRQVGHYWLRNPDLASTEQSNEITSSWSLLEDLAHVVAEGEYTDLLMVGMLCQPTD